MANLKVESLDDLFEDEQKTETAKNEPQEEIKEREQEIKVENNTPTEINVEERPKERAEAPILPQEEEEEVFSMDIQKELEAKFDELFGPLDE